MKFFFLICTLFSLTLRAQDILVPQKNSTLEIKIPYTMGTHNLATQNFSGEIHFDTKTKTLLSGTITLLVTDIMGKDNTLLCHLQESLTLDYGPADFPENHVCDNNKLPVEGKNAPVYKTISATLLAPYKLGDTHMSLKWSIHGQEKELSLPGDVSWDERTHLLKIRSEWSMKRSDFGIVVKKFLFIDADNKIPLNLDLTFGVKP